MEDVPDYFCEKCLKPTPHCSCKQKKDKECIVHKDGEPCEHVGCLNHVTHLCEGCGRIEGKRFVFVSDVIKVLEGLNEYVYNNSFGPSEFPDDMLMITSKCIKTEITRTINTIQKGDR
jgi:hypothetical protein